MVSREQLVPPLPQNHEAERAVLGAVVVNNGALETAAKILSPRDFFFVHHANIFKLMLEMQASGIPIDSLTLYDAATRDGGLERLGGVEYLATIGDGVPSALNVSHYACIVLRAARLRSIALLSDGLAQEALAPGADPDALTDRLSEISVSCGNHRVIPGHERFRSAADVLTKQDEQADCLAEPWLVVGAITEICGKIKTSGKTTLAVHLCRCILDGAPFLGRPTKRSPIVYLSEAPAASFIPAMRSAGIGDRSDFVIGFWGNLASLTWEAIAKSAVEECKKIGAGLLVVDTLSQFSGLAGDSENDAGAGLAAVRPLQLAAAAGLAVLVLRHERKSGGAIGEAGRGSSAISGAVDLIVSLRRPEGHSNGRMRVVEAIGRLPNIPTDPQIIELTDQGYVLQGSREDLAIAARQSILSFFCSLPSDVVGQKQKCTLKEITEACNVSRASAQRAVEDLYQEGLLGRSGSGRRGDPYEYFVSAQHNHCVENSEQKPTEDGRGIESVAIHVDS